MKLSDAVTGLHRLDKVVSVAVFVLGRQTHTAVRPISEQ